MPCVARYGFTASCSSGAQQSSYFRPVQPRDTASSRSPCWPPRQLHARLCRSPVVYVGTPRPPIAILDESCINRIRAPALRALRGCSTRTSRFVGAYETAVVAEYQFVRTLCSMPRPYVAPRPTPPCRSPCWFDVRGGLCDERLRADNTIYYVARVSRNARASAF